MVMALSSMVLISSQVSSWTKPTWLASMKQGSHIMLQRLVRSMVSTDPRPCSTVLLPWWWSFSSLWARISRPGKTSSRCLKNAVSMAITSSKWPWMGQSFTIRILPSRSMICALISPAFSFMRTSRGSLPSMISWRICGTHLGHSESVERGQPSGGLDFWYDFNSGLSDHLGVNDGLGLMLFNLSKTAHAPLAAMVTAFSTYLTGLCIYASRTQENELRIAHPTNTGQVPHFSTVTKLMGERRKNQPR